MRRDAAPYASVVPTGLLVFATSSFHSGRSGRLGGADWDHEATAPSEQPAQQASDASQYSLQQAEDSGQQTTYGTTKTPQQAHRV